jgi:hypothetical protein
MYYMDFYCKYFNDKHEYGEFPFMPFEVQTKSEAIAAARKLGWLYHRDGTATCPKCR